MCDSFTALGNSTASGSVLLAKSADTEVNEAEQVVRYPRREYAEGALARITHRTIPQATRTHQVILGRSFWAWGAELACNEHGVAVGNEAAFSNQKHDRRRHVLPRSGAGSASSGGATALEAVEAVGEVVSAFGQGGNCPDDGQLSLRHRAADRRPPRSLGRELRGKALGGTQGEGRNGHLEPVPDH